MYSDNSNGILQILANCLFNSNQGNKPTYKLNALESEMARNELKRAYMDAKGFDSKVKDAFANLDADIEKIVGDAEKVKKYIVANIQLLAIELTGVFSTKKVFFRQEKMNEFIKWAIDYIISNGIEMPKTTQEYLKQKEGEQFAWVCIKNMVCMITGESDAQLCHVETVKSQYGYRKHDDGTKCHYMSLSAEKHAEQHTIGIDSFLEKYKLTPIKLSDEQIKIMGFKEVK